MGKDQALMSTEVECNEDAKIGKKYATEFVMVVHYKRKGKLPRFERNTTTLRVLSAGICLTQEMPTICNAPK